MKVGLYHQHRDDVAGGAEQVVVVIAEALARDHQVDLLHHKSALTLERLAHLYGADLRGVRLRHVPAITAEISWAEPWNRYRAERSRYAGITREYDLLIASVYEVPPFCHAKRGALYIHFPYFDRDATWPWVRDGNRLSQRLRRAYARWEWARRFSGYQVAMVNSEFTREYTRRWWGLDSRVVYAPAKSDFRVVPKQNAILSVGRFATGGTSKRQLEMAEAFVELRREGLHNWSYASVGGLNQLPADRAFFDRVRVAGAAGGARVEANVSRAQLDELYEGAKIFWHGAGYGGLEQRPDLMEHFGIVTAEAMAAGCVPVVNRKGGQAEIVEHGVNGFLWDTLDELREFTRRLAGDDGLRSRMSDAARARAQRFSRAAYADRLREALRPLTG